MPEAPRPSTGGARLHGIDGLRGLACAAVVLIHSWQHAAPGWPVGPNWLNYYVIGSLSASLTLFFTLSAFLLYQPFVRSIVRGTPLPDTRRYLRNRVLRIYPAYVVVFVLAVLVLGAGGAPANLLPTGVPQLNHALGPGNAVANLLLLQSYSPRHVMTGLLPTWSLGVEVVFYLLLPVIGVGTHALARRFPDRRPWVLALVAPVALLVLGIATKVLVDHLGYVNTDRSWVTVLARSFPASADQLTFGMVAAVLLVAAREGALGRIPNRLLAAGTVVVTVVAIVFHESWGEHAYTVVMALACGLGVLFVGQSTPTSSVSMRVLTSRPIDWIGERAYGVFLWHWPVIYLLRQKGVTGGAGVAASVADYAVVYGVTLTLAALTYRFVELPAMALKARPAVAPAAPPLSAVRG